MKLENIWVITKPTPNSEMVDICFETDMPGLWLQFAGGLRADEIIGLYTERQEAEKVAMKLLNIN